VVSPWRRPRKGAANLGFIISLALFAAALYYGVNIGQVYLRYHQLLDGMRSQARLASGLQDEVICRRLGEQADSLFPAGSPRFKITRGGHPNRIVIETEYDDRVNLPFFKYTFVMRPRTEERL
jgi:hypothetical protein